MASKISFPTATSLVIANMIGTGVFTSLGFQCAEIKSVFLLLMLWIIGGIMALCGALCYAEIGAAMPRSGGEYHYLSKIFHPSIGFLSGWISVTVGFSAPVALAAMALGNYFSSVFPVFNSMHIAILVVTFLTFIHCYDIHLGSRTQNVFTAVKILLIVTFIICGFIFSDSQSIDILPTTADITNLGSSAFITSLFFISYSYSGWNASAYIGGEIENPQRNIPRSLIIGTLIVTVLYVLLNFIFLYTTPIADLAGQLEVGFISANKIFGSTGGKIIGITISLLLVSTISAMIIVGPRVTQAVGEDFSMLKIFGKKNAKGIPVIAIIFQSSISLFLILTATFETVLIYLGFTLNLFTFLTVLGLFVLRKKMPHISRPYKTFGYPYTPIIFLLFSSWLLVYGIIYKPVESIIGFATVLTGLILYFQSKKQK